MTVWVRIEFICVEAALARDDILDPVNHAIGLMREAEKEGDVAQRVAPAFGASEGIVKQFAGVGGNNAIELGGQQERGDRRQGGPDLEWVQL